MERQEVIERILKFVGISDRQVDLTEKIFSLEQDTERIVAVNLYHNTTSCRGLSAQVILLENFQSVNDFRNYLKSKELPTESTWEKDGSYMLINSRIQTEFLVPDSYPKES